MTSHDLESVARALVADGKGILAADETIPTLTRRFDIREQNLAAGQEALSRRARCNGAASLGKYTDEMEAASQSADDPPHRQDWSDD